MNYRIGWNYWKNIFFLIIELMDCLEMINEWIGCSVFSFEYLSANIASGKVGLIVVLRTIVPDIRGLGIISRLSAECKAGWQSKGSGCNGKKKSTLRNSAHLMSF